MTTSALDRPVPFVAPSQKQMAFLWKLAAQKVLPAGFDEDGEWAADLDKRGASAAIDLLLSYPNKPQTSLAHEDGNAVGEGYYSLAGDVYKVVKAKTTGNLYAKKFARTGYEYAPGAMKVLAGAARLTLEQASDMGRATGICVICGRTLSDPTSVAAGIGPVCAGRL